MTALPPSVRGRSLRGHLRVVAAPDARGQTYLRDQSFRAPLHLSKPHREADALVINVVSPTAGLFDGDEVDLALTVEPGARVVLTTPSACRIHRARGERPAVMRQEITVRAGGFAEYFPEPVIPQSGARYHQETTLRVDPGGTLLFFEWLTPGRVAHGELFAYAALQWHTDLWIGESLAARERYTLRPDGPHLAGLRLAHPAGHYLGVFVVGDVPPPCEIINALQGADVDIGCGPLAIDGAWTIKALCAQSLVARQTLAALRAALYHALELEMPSLRRF
ncbi:MAG: urease accessory protein UreD [Verrucomicrobiales bacterium]